MCFDWYFGLFCSGLRLEYYSNWELGARDLLGHCVVHWRWEDELRQTSRCDSGDAVFRIFRGYFLGFLETVRINGIFLLEPFFFINKVVDHGDQTFLFSTSQFRTSRHYDILSASYFGRFKGYHTHFRHYHTYSSQLTDRPFQLTASFNRSSTASDHPLQPIISSLFRPQDIANTFTMGRGGYNGPANDADESDEQHFSN